MLFLLRGLSRFIGNYWDAISSVLTWTWALGGGAVTAWATWATGLFKTYAPFSWVAAGIVGMASFGLMALIVAAVFAQFHKAKLFQKSSEKTLRINPLEAEFTRSKIDVADFVHPVGFPTVGKTFTECELYGPSVILLSECLCVGQMRHFNCEFIRFGSKQKLNFFPNKAVFSRCTLTRCVFVNCLVLASFKSDEDLKQSFPNALILQPPTSESSGAQEMAAAQ